MSTNQKISGIEYAISFCLIVQATSEDMRKRVGNLEEDMKSLKSTSQVTMEKLDKLLEKATKVTKKRLQDFHLLNSRHKTFLTALQP